MTSIFSFLLIAHLGKIRVSEQHASLEWTRIFNKHSFHFPCSLSEVLNQRNEGVVHGEFGKCLFAFWVFCIYETFRKGKVLLQSKIFPSFNNDIFFGQRSLFLAGISFEWSSFPQPAQGHHMQITTPTSLFPERGCELFAAPPCSVLVVLIDYFDGGVSRKPLSNIWHYGRVCLFVWL